MSARVSPRHLSAACYPRQLESLDHPFGNLLRRQIRVVDPEIVRASVELAVGAQLISRVELQQLTARLLEVPLERLLGEPKLRLVPPQSLGLTSLELDERHAASARAEDRRPFLHCGLVARVVERPDVREDESREVARRDLLEDATAEIPDQPVEGWR